MSAHQADGDVGTTWVALWCDAGTGEPVFVACFVVAQSVSNYYQAVQYQPETVKVWIITAPRRRSLCNGMTGLLFNRLRQMCQETTIKADSNQEPMRLGLNFESEIWKYESGARQSGVEHCVLFLSPQPTLHRQLQSTQTLLPIYFVHQFPGQEPLKQEWI